MVLVHDFLSGDYRGEQAAVFLDAVLCDDFSMLRDDEPAFLQQSDIACDGVSAVVKIFSHSRSTWMTLASPSVCMTQQEDVDSD